jgi:hypothetical protein
VRVEDPMKTIAALGAVPRDGDVLANCSDAEHEGVLARLVARP